MKITISLFLMFCFCHAELYAQEIVGQGWTVAEPRQRSSSAIPVTATGNARDLARSSSGVLSSAAVSQPDGEESRPPFPVLTPRAIVYPRKAVWKRWEGQAVIAAEILPGGTVGRTALAKSSGHELLDNTAQEAIKTWKFAAESEQDDIVPQYVDIPVTFKLEER